MEHKRIKIYNDLKNDELLNFDDDNYLFNYQK